MYLNGGVCTFRSCDDLASVDKTKLGERIRQLRKGAGFTSQEEFCEKAGFSMKVIRSIESGHGNPTLKNLETIASVLRVPFLELFSNQDGASLKVASDATKPPSLFEVRKVLREEIQAIKQEDALFLALSRLSEADRNDLIAIANRRLSAAGDQAKARARRK